jgi:hypothetical protein
MSQAVNSPSNPLFHLCFLQMRFQILLPYSLFGLALLLIPRCILQNAIIQNILIFNETGSY